MAPPGTPAPDPAPSPAAHPAAPYGPNTSVVRRFLQRFAALGPREWDAAALAYAARDPGLALAADRDLGRVVERSDRTAHRDAVLGPLLQLVRLDEPPDPLSDPPSAEPPGPVPMHPVAEAALAATLALIVEDVLPARAFTVLYEPFHERIPRASLADAPPVR